MSNNIQKIIQTIDRCPTWIRTGDDRVNKQLILKELLSISKYQINEIEKAVSEYVRQKESSKYFNTLNMAKIYILNRYLFNVPKYVPIKNRKAFSGFFGMPVNDRGIGEMWPLDFDKSGKMIIVDDIVMYNGPGYKALQEFRHFRYLYGLRKQKG